MAHSLLMDLLDTWSLICATGSEIVKVMKVKVMNIRINVTAGRSFFISTALKVL